MSEKAVDVLHAIDQANTALGVAGLAENDIFRAELSAALAAVAELIEAANQAHAYLCERAPGTATEYRLRAALARCGGAK